MRTLLIGMGRMGFKGFDDAGIETHYEQILSHRSLKLVGTCDNDVRLRFGPYGETIVPGTFPHFTDYTEALVELSPELVIVATPSDTHKDICIELSKCAGVVGILCEKPLAPTVADCQAIINACGHKALLVGHHRRYEKRHCAMRDLAQNEILGPVESVTVIYGGDAMNIGTHAFDTVNFIAPEASHKIVGGGSNKTFITTVVAKFGIMSLSSYKDYAPGYLHTMYEDLIFCATSGAVPVSNGKTGMAAVAGALELDRAAA